MRVIRAELPVGRAIALAAALALSIIGSTPSPAFGGTGEEINALPTLDALNRSEESLSNGGKWAPPVWASSPSGHPTGRDNTTGWGPYDSFPTMNGAYWKPSVLTDKPGAAAAVAMEAGGGAAGTSQSVWLDMQTPTSSKSGYQLRWTATATAGVYVVTLSKWVAGSEVPLASNSSISIAPGSRLAISDVGGTVMAWLGSKGGLLPVLSAADSTYGSGYAGIDGSGPSGRLADFKAGVLGMAVVTGVPLLDDLERQEMALATGKWSKMAWAGTIGSVFCCSPSRGFGSNSGVAGAYWNQTPFTQEGEGARVAATIGSGAPLGQSFALWLDMPAPTSSRWGYEAKFIAVGAETYKVELARWLFGSRALMSSYPAVSLPAGTTIALSDRGEKVEVATGTTALTPLLSVTDTSNSTGFAGLEVSGAGPSLNKFRAGSIDLQAPDTTITAGPTGSVASSSVSFEFKSPEAGATLGCSLDGGAYSSCTSPKPYSGLARGSHTFRVRASDAVGNVDQTPAERTFSVITPPVVTTSPATGVTSKAATLKGSANPSGLETTYQFEYGTTTSLGTNVPATAKSIGAGIVVVQVSEPLSGLASGTTYFFRLSATNVDGTIKGVTQTFTTVGAPVVIMDSATNLTATSASLNGSVNPRGSATTYQFEYGPTTAYGSKAPATAASAGSGSSLVPVSANLSNLSETVTYHYRLVAVNEAGTTYGPDWTFTTLTAPDVVTEAGETVDANSVIVEGSVDPNGTATSYRVQYGTTAAYGQESAVGYEELGTSSGEAEIVEPLSALKPATTYHYRLVATSAAGTEQGVDKTVTTGPAEMTPAEELIHEEEKVAYTGKRVPPPPGNDFAGLHQHGEHRQAQARKSSINAVKYSGADWLRIMINGDVGTNTLETIFARASNKGINLLPYIPTQAVPTAEQRAFNVKYVEEVVGRYGPGGTFWKSNKTASGVPIEKVNPPLWWEIGNEPNLAGSVQVDPKVFGAAFKEMSDAAKKAANVQVLLAGLFSTNGTTNQPSCKAANSCAMTVRQFINQMNYEGAYDAMSLHPYVLKVDGAAPKNGENGTIGRTMHALEQNVIEARQALNQNQGAGKKIWITEFGWTTGYRNDGSVPPVTLGAQRELIERAYSLFREIRLQRDISRAFYFGLQDYIDPNALDNPPKAPANLWAYGTGLRFSDGENKPGWAGFAIANNGRPGWPGSPKVKKPLTTLGMPRYADVQVPIDTDGTDASYYFEYRQKPNGQWKTGGSGTAEGEEGNQIVGGRLTGLTAGTVYEYRGVAINDQKITTVGSELQELTTEEMNPTTGTFSHLNGEPGWVSVHGWSKYDGVGVPGGTIRVVFHRPSDGTLNTYDVPLSNGQYRLDNYPVGRGIWSVWATRLPQPGYPESSTEAHPIDMKNGYRLVAKHSSKCLDVYNGMTGEGASLIQYTCSAGLSNNQVFKLVPMDNQARYQIVARHSNRCVGVTAGSQSVQQLSQSLCVGAPHQTWQGQYVLPNGVDNSYNRFVAQHTNWCMEVQESKTLDGQPVIQYPCNGEQANQLWTFQSVDAGQVPTETFLTNEPNNSFHGMPGLVSFHGYLSAGDRAYPLAGRTVHVKFDRANGQGVFDGIPDSSVAVTTDGSGYYSYKYWPLWQGDWKGWAVFEGTGDALGRSETAGKQQITTASAPSILSGYRLRFRSTDKCLGTQNNGTSNGTHMVQKTCNTGSTPLDGQVFSLWPAAPIGANHWQLRPNTASYPVDDAQCVDVNGAQLEDHAEVNLFECVGAANQSWELPPMPPPNEPYIFARAQHSQKCMDVPGGNASEGLQIRQFQCIWNGNQQLKWILVP